MEKISLSTVNKVTPVMCKCFIMQKIYILKIYAYLTSTGRNGYQTDLDEDILEICRYHSEVMADTVGSSSTGIASKGIYF